MDQIAIPDDLKRDQGRRKKLGQRRLLTLIGKLL